MSKILVVDDEPDILMTIRLALRIAGHEVIDAADGMQALDRAQELPDAILLDIRLPDIDGLEVLRRLKADENVREIPVLCLSAHSSPNTKAGALNLGAYGYMSKPFDLAKLKDVVQEMVNQAA